MPNEKNVTYDKAYKFAIRIVNAYKYLQKEKKEFVLSKQLLRSGTSIGTQRVRAVRPSGLRRFASCLQKPTVVFLQPISQLKYLLLQGHLPQVASSDACKLCLLQETLETKYWLSLLKDTGYIDKKTFSNIYLDADEIAKILFSILKSTRIKT